MLKLRRIGVGLVAGIFGGGKTMIHNRILVMSLVMLLALSLVAVACPPPAELVVEPVPQVLTVGVVSCPFGERWKFMGGISPYATAGMFEPLLYLAPDMSAHPGLATSWELIDEKTWRFELRQGVRFHSGRPFNAEAARSGLLASVKHLGIGFLRIETVTVVGEYTIDIHTTIPMPVLPEWLTHQVTFIANVDQEGAIVPDGTGPFEFYSIDAGVEFVVVRNEDYWGEAPKLDRITFKVIPDHTTRVIALLAGEVDFITTVPLPDIRRLDKDPEITIYPVVRAWIRNIAFTLFKEPVNDVLVRRAINHAIDREVITDVLLDGMGKVAHNFVIPQMPWSIYHDEPEGFPFDPEKARRLLAEAGWTDTDGDGIVDKDGKPFRISMILTVAIPETLPIAEAVQGMLREVGIDLELLVLEGGLFFERSAAGTH